MVRIVKCHIENCKNSSSNSDLKFYRFPKPGKTNIQRCRIWALFARPTENWETEEKLSKLYTEHRHLCAKHFKPDAFQELHPTKIRIHAIPTLAPASTSVGPFPPTSCSPSSLSTNAACIPEVRNPSLSSSCSPSSSSSSPLASEVPFSTPSSSLPSSSSVSSPFSSEVLASTPSSTLPSSSSCPSTFISEVSAPAHSSSCLHSSSSTPHVFTSAVPNPTPSSSCLPSASSTPLASISVVPDPTQSSNLPSSSTSASAGNLSIDCPNGPQIATPHLTDKPSAASDDVLRMDTDGEPQISTPSHPINEPSAASSDTQRMETDGEPPISTPSHSRTTGMSTPTLGSKIATKKRKRIAARRSLLSQINVTRLDHLTPRKKLLVQSHRKKEKEVARMKREYALLKEQTSAPNVLDLAPFKKLPKFLRLMIEATLRCVACHPNGRRWTIEEKLQSLAVFKNSPRSYRLLRKLFPLPSGRTLRTLLGRIPYSTGVNKQVLNALGESLKNCDPKDRYVSLIFDEMSIRKCMSWNGQTDQVDGFQDHGSQGRSKKVAEQALVFMIQGLRKKYKQPVAYYFSSASTSGERMSVLIKEVIKGVEDAGFKVITTVCDLGGNNVKALELLGSTWEKPYFDYNGHRIYTIYDVCHLLKCTRNNFRKKNIKLTVVPKGVRRYTGTAKWSHIRKVVNEDRKRVFRALRNIKDKHLDPRGAQKMKVNLAAQIFSKTMASCVENPYAHGILKDDESAMLTSCVCNTFDDVFDACNGQGKIAKDGKCLRLRMDANSPHVQKFIEAEKFISGMEYEGHTITNRPPSQNGWLATLRATRYIWEDLQKEGFDYIDTKRLNSDPIECQFGAFRCNCGGNNQRPNVPQFVGAFKTSVLNNTTNSNTRGNCEYDQTALLNDLKELIGDFDKQLKADAEVATLIDQVDIAVGPIVARSARLKAAIKAGDNESRPIAHIAGFVAKQLIAKMKCKTCTNRLLTKSLGPCHSLIKAKEFRKDKQSLTYCCEKFVETVGTSLYYCDDLIEQHPHITHIKAKITKKLGEKYFLQWLISSCCSASHAKHMVKLFCENIFHITIKWWCQRKNRAFAKEKSDQLQAKRKLKILKHQ